MNDPMQTARARAALDAGEGGDEPKPIEIGRFAPYPVWMAVTVLVRGAQIAFLGCCGWYLAALFDAMSRPHTISTPPIWLWIATALIGADDGRSFRRWLTSPAGDSIGRLFASKQCPACGQNVFDHRPPSGYAPPSQGYALLPSRICTNCGHDLRKRTAS